MISLNEHLTPALSPLASDANAEREAEVTLAIVRELSERWHHRPALKKLFCIPVQAFALKRAPVRPLQTYRDFLLTTRK